MEGVRVSGIDAQCSVQVLWQYFDDTGGVVKAIYYPLLNNDAVIIFQHPSGTTDALTHNHQKWKVSPLPNQVFRQQRVWVEADLSVLVQATQAYQDCLRNTGQLHFSLDSTSGELVLSGQPYQIEWAWNYLSSLRDSQFHIARTLQTEAVSPSGLSNGSLRVGHPAYEPSSHGTTHSPYDRRHEAEQQKKGKVNVEGLTDVTSLKLENLNSVYDLPPRSSERYEDDRQGGRRSPDLHAEDVLGAGIRQTSTYSEKRDTKRSTDVRERRRRQDDANDTFNKFASLPASNSRPAYGESSQRTDPERLSVGSRRDVLPSTMPSQTRLENSESESRLEREFQSLGFRDSGDHYHSTGGYQSLQIDYGRQRDNVHSDEDRARSLYSRERPSAVAAAAAAAADDDPSLYALSTTSAELTNKQFQIGKSLILKIYLDNITKTRTDAVVNAANWELKNLGGVAGALARAAGPEMEEECRQLHRKHGSLSTAQVVKTKAYGQLAHLKYVIHTVGPIYISTDVDRSVFELAQTFLNCLEFAEKLCLTSVTFPFISTGIFGMPVEHCILSLVTALQVFSENGTAAHSHLQEVHFVNNDVNVVCEAIIMMEQRLALETSLTARQRLNEGVEHYGRYVFPYCQSTSSRRYESERYATWDSTKLKKTADAEDRDRSRSSAQPSSHLLSDSGEMRSLPLSDSKTGGHRQRSSSLDRRNLTVHSGSTQPLSSPRTAASRDPSPRPQARPRSNSLTLSGRTPSASTKPSTSTSASQLGGGSGGGGGGGKQKPVIKKSLTGVSNKATGLAKKLASKKHSQSAGRSADYSGNDTDSASAAGSEMDEADRNCTICLEPLRHPRKLPCGHTFCSDCIDLAFSVQPSCPRCKTRFTTSSRKQPKDGTMTYTCSQSSDLPGYEGCGTIIIKYSFPPGKQEDCHPHPGRPYEGVYQTAYLPDNFDGNEVLKRLKKAFDCGLVFTIGASSTGGRDVVTWNDIPHKTSKTGGPLKSGYPDPGFLKHVREKLAAKGITSA